MVYTNFGWFGGWFIIALPTLIPNKHKQQSTRPRLKVALDGPWGPLWYPCAESQQDEAAAGGLLSALPGETSEATGCYHHSWTLVGCWCFGEWHRCTQAAFFLILDGARCASVLRHGKRSKLQPEDEEHASRRTTFSAGPGFWIFCSLSLALSALRPAISMGHFRYVKRLPEGTFTSKKHRYIFRDSPVPGLLINIFQWKSPLWVENHRKTIGIVDFPKENGDFPPLCDKLPKGIPILRRGQQFYGTSSSMNMSIYPR